METKKRWTKEEDEILVQAISANPHNLSKCFIAVAEQTGRGVTGVQYRWYRYVKFTAAGRKAMLTLSPVIAYSGKNKLDNSKNNPIEVRRPSIWRRLLALLKIK